MACKAHRLSDNREVYMKYQEHGSEGASQAEMYSLAEHWCTERLEVLQMLAICVRQVTDRSSTERSLRASSCFCEGERRYRNT